MSVIRFDYAGRSFEAETAPGLFSPSHPDRGTLAMLSRTAFAPGQKVLDLGCGWGIVGLCAAAVCGADNVWMCDIDPGAVETARKNMAGNGFGEAHLLVSDGLSQVPEAGFDLILSNPPYQTDFSVAKSFILKGFNRLKIGGSMILVVKREEWYKNRLRAVFGGVRSEPVDGYHVMTAQRRSAERAGR